MTTIRNFDALNDVNNLIYSGKCIVDAGLKHEVCVTMMELPPGCEGAHDAPFYTRTLKQILDAGIAYDSVCFKDASGTSTPSKVYETIKAARELLGPDKHLVFHSHETAGTGILCYKAALDAGANQIDLSMAPVSGGTCQTDIVTMWHALRGTEFDLGIDINKVLEAEEVFKECMKDYFMPPEALAVEPLIPFSPMPGGALTANTQMMRDNGIIEKYPQVAAAMGEVVRKGGFGTSVTPVSQFYFQQAFNNVFDGPWKKIAPGYGKMVLGYFGKTPVAPDPEIVKIASEQLKLEPTTKSTLENDNANPKKGVKFWTEQLQKENLKVTDENIFIAACCEDKGILFLKGQAKVNIHYAKKESAAGSAASGLYTVTVNNKNYTVKLDGDKVAVNGRDYSVGVKEGGTEIPAGEGSGTANTVKAPVPGLILKIPVQVGDHVNEGDVVIVMESMKMATNIATPFAGKVASIAVAQGQQMKTGDNLVVIEG
jgi:pyruvate carboxylase subunit B